MVSDYRTDRSVGRHHRSGVHLFDHPGSVEGRGSRIALRTESPVTTEVRVVFTNMVFAGKRVLVIARAFVNRGAFRAATFSVVHTGSHFSLTFDHGSKSSMIFCDLGT